MAYLSPLYQREIGVIAPATGFTVYAASYPDAQGNRRIRTWHHSTPKATLRRLGSLCDSGRSALHMADDFAVFAVNSQGDTLSYYDIKRMI